MLLSRLRIRGKIALLVVFPLLAAVSLAIPVVADRVRQADRAAATAERAQLARQVGQLIQGLQQERLLLFGVVFRVAKPAQLREQVQLTTTRVAGLRELPTVRRSPGLQQALDGTRALAGLTSAAGGDDFQPDRVVLTYGDVIARLIDALRLQEGMDGATPEGRQMVALDASMRSDEGICVAATFAFLIVATKEDRAVALYFAALAAIDLSVDRFKLFATSEQQVLYKQEEKRVQETFGPAFSANVGSDPRPLLAGFPLRLLLPALLAHSGSDRAVSSKIISDVEDEVDRERDYQLTTAYLVGGAALLLVLAVAALSVLTARRVIRPLTLLTESADRIARLTQDELVRAADDEMETGRDVRLDPVVVEAMDEIGDLARAFERVRGTAVSLVQRQVLVRRNVAQMFGHVGRRTQNLVGRQIAFIERLEAEEGDPRRRAELSQLDHVANRLRRNASSLVVLSGENSPDERVSPLALVDVARLALAEIESGHRIDLEIPRDIALIPAVINDLVLIIAELMENATVFSPPDTRVSVIADSTARGAVARIVDHGIGMSDTQLATENGRLRHRERLDIAPTGALGLFVVGRLARRHGLRIALLANPGGGTVVNVEIPRGLLSTDATPERVSVPDRVRSGRGAPTAALSGPRPTRAGDRFDAALLERACEVMHDAPSWGAFVPHQRSPWADVVGAEEVAFPGSSAMTLESRAHPGEDTTLMIMPSPPELPSSGGVAGRALVTENHGPRFDHADVPTARAGELSALTAPLGGIGTAPATPAAPPPVIEASTALPRLDRRVPGAALAAGGGDLASSSVRGRAPVPRQRADADAVRDLVEQFESGVERALADDVRHRSTVEGTRL
ncbi:HAMP domain-containing sensor histidine kinase [Pilimelia columellifera]|uniref:sensor histidine kinase n=1 Tax=Pilimelia columellifera TaxID=706574 RepID=UPI0031DCA3B8